MPSPNMETFTRLQESADMKSDLTSKKAQKAMWDAYHEDFEILEPSSLPTGGLHQGREAWLAMNNLMRSLWAQKVWIDEMIDLPERDLIILYSTMEWTGRKTGRSVTIPAVELLYFKDALIARIEMFFQDTHALLDLLDPEDRSPSRLMSG
jgi:uncharacterized protein